MRWISNTEVEVTVAYNNILINAFTDTKKNHYKTNDKCVCAYTRGVQVKPGLLSL
jgi:hypothetical protein